MRYADSKQHGLGAFSVPLKVELTKVISPCLFCSWEVVSALRQGSLFSWVRRLFSCAFFFESHNCHQSRTNDKVNTPALSKVVSLCNGGAGNPAGLGSRTSQQPFFIHLSHTIPLFLLLFLTFVSFFDLQMRSSLSLNI
jgi:hypothetical protein